MLIFGDAGAMQYTLHFDDISQCRRHIAGHDCQRRRKGFGPWTVVEKRSGEIVGFGGLCDDPFDPGWGVEMIYHFAPAVWGRGYATELTRFCLGHAREVLRLPEVLAFAHPNNIASRRVLEKTGFEQQRFVPEMNRHLYRRWLADA